VTLQSLFRDSIGAHALQFEKPLAPSYEAAAGMRILAAFVIVGIAMLVAMRFAFDRAGVRGPGASLGLVAAWLTAFVLVHRSFVRVPFAAVGRARSAVDAARRLYFFEVVPLAAVVFVVLFRAHL
jgi:hypothetical protein